MQVLSSERGWHEQAHVCFQFCSHFTCHISQNPWWSPCVPFHLFDLSRFHPSGTECCPGLSVWPEQISPLWYSVLSRSICFDLSRFHPFGRVCCPSPSVWPEPISPLRYSVLSQSICLTWADFTPSVQCAVPVHLFDLSRFHPPGTVCCPIPALWPEPISPLRYSVMSQSICLTSADFTPGTVCYPILSVWPEPISTLWYCMLTHSISLTWADFTPSVQCAVPVHLFDLSRFHPSGTVCCPIPSLWPEPISPLRYSVLSRSICFDLSRFHPSGTVCCPSPSVLPEPISTL